MKEVFEKVYGVIKTPEYVFKELVHRVPAPFYKPDFNVDEDLKENFRQLQTNGITVLDRIIDAEYLELIREEFDAVIENQKGSNPDSYHSIEPFLKGVCLLDLALERRILGLVAQYFRKPFGLSRTDALRLLPTTAGPHGSFQWHHDTRGKQLHAMILLTDVGADGQAMRYLNGSHRKVYSYHRGRQKPLFNKDVSELKIKNISYLVGRAGSVALFDSNGLHAGHRNNSYTRDSLTFCFATWRHFFPVKVRRGAFDKLSREQQGVLLYNPKLTII